LQRLEQTSTVDDMVVIEHTTSEKHLRRSERALSIANFNSLGSGYTLPTADHKYKVKHGLNFGEFGTKPTP
jgi:hypothetical protein